MTVILLVATFLAFAIIDYLLNRKRAPVPAPEEAQAPAIHGEYVEGFLVPSNVRYHPGHTWILQERKGLCRVGADEFAAALAGHIDSIELPKPGQWIRQGQKIVTVTRNGETTELISPIEGEVASVNSELAGSPTLLRDDPYGRGWFLTVAVPDEESTFRNLIPKGIVQDWMADAVSRLYNLQPLAAHGVAADGGRPVADLLEHVPDVSWTAVTRGFFLTEN